MRYSSSHIASNFNVCANWRWLNRKCYKNVVIWDGMTLTGGVPKMKKKYLVIFFRLIYFPKRDSYPEEQLRLLTAINTWYWEGTDRQKDTWSYNLPLVAFPTSCFICSHLLCALCSQTDFVLRSLVWPIQMKSNKEVSSAFSPSSQCSRSLCEIASDFCFVSNKLISLIFTSLFLSSLILV